MYPECNTCKKQEHCWQSDLQTCLSEIKFHCRKYLYSDINNQDVQKYLYYPDIRQYWLFFRHELFLLLIPVLFCNNDQILLLLYKEAEHYCQFVLSYLCFQK